MAIICTKGSWLASTLAGVFVAGLASGGLAAEAPRGAEPGAQLIKQAFAQAEPRFEPAFERNCSLDAPFPLANGRGGPAVPAKLFDNFYYVGRTDVGAWLIKTSGGLVLIDTLYTAAEAEQVIIPGIRKLGLDPDQIKMVLITHNHGDHAGGISYFQKKGVPIMVSELDWPALGGAPGPSAILHDRQVLTVGDTKITALHTPGHTPGTVSYVFPVTQDGKRHMALLMGGVGPRGDAAVHAATIASTERMLQFGQAQGVDVLFQIHEAFEDPIAMQAILDAPTRRPGQPNPLVLGQQRFQNFGRMLQTCWRARIEMMQAGRGRAGRGAGAP